MCAASASLLYLKGGAYMAVGSPTDGPNDAVQNNVLFIHYGIVGEGDFIPGFPWFVRGNLPTGALCPVLSKRRQG